MSFQTPIAAQIVLHHGKSAEATSTLKLMKDKWPRGEAPPRGRVEFARIMEQTPQHDTATPPEVDERPLGRVLSHLEQVTGSGPQYSARCPAHDDSRNSLSVGEDADGTVLLHCHAGCPTEKILAATGLSYDNLYPPNRTGADLPGVTVERYAAAKRLDADVLKDEFKLKTVKRNGQYWTEMPSFDEDGKVVSTSHRKNLTKTNGIDDRFQRKKGDSAVPYGLWRLDQARERDSIILVEGESDVQTLAHHGEPALGLPGASTWKPEYADLLDDISEVYLVDEGDRGGATLKAAIAKSSIRSRVRVIDLGEHKDPSGLNCADPERFPERWAAAKAEATPLPDPDDTREAEAAEALATAGTLLDDPALLEHVSRVISARGYAGDTNPVLAATVAITSRNLENPMNIAFVAQSGAGKNRAVDEACALHPPEAVYVIKAASERALIYNNEDFEHRTVIFAEADSIPDEGPAASAVRNLATDNAMEYEVTIRDDATGHFTTRLIRKPGPTGLFTTSTKSARDQLGTRLLEYAIPDDVAQTRAVMRAQARHAMPPTSAPPDVGPIVAAQRYLALKGESRVAVPFGEILAEILPADAVRTRRDFSQLLTAIQTVAFLYQFQRERTPEGWVMATIDDYAWARRIFGSCFDVLVAEGVTPQIRAIVEAAPGDEDDGIALNELARRAGKSPSTTSYHAKRALAHGWLVNDAPRGRDGYKLRRGAALPEARSVLPAPEELREIFESSKAIRGDEDPPPDDPSPSGGRIEVADRDTSREVGGNKAPKLSSGPSDPRALETRGCSSPRNPLEDSKITLITDGTMLADCLVSLPVSMVIGLDCETTGLDPRRDAVRLVTIATPDGTLVLDVGAIPDWANRLRPLLTDPDILKVLHNAKFDLAFLDQAGVEVTPIFDTMLASQLLDGGRNLRKPVPDPSGRAGHGGKPATVGYHALAAVAHRELGVVVDKTAQTADWSGLLETGQIAYAAADAAVLLPLQASLTAQLEERGLAEVAALEFATVSALVWLEQAGMPLDVAGWTALRDQARAEQARLAARISELLPNVNLNAPRQLISGLAELGIHIPNAQEGTLRLFADAHPVIALILAYKDAAKRVGTYGDGYLTNVHSSTGRIHADYHQIGTETGRMACSKPNLQNIPRDPAYRACIRPAAGRVLVKADLALIELCAAAEISGDTRMLEAITKGDDLHRLTAAAIFAKDPTAVTRDERAFGKTVNFGTLYGQGLQGLREAARDQGLILSEAEARTCQLRFAKAWPKLTSWKVRQLDSSSSQVRTRSGRIRRLKSDASGTLRVNTPIQGLAADGFKAALAELWATRRRVPSAAPVLAVHDELVVEVDAAKADNAARWVSDCLQAGMRRYLTRVPVRVEVTIARDWSGTSLDAVREEHHSAGGT